jgi:hypothetical protein
MFYLLFLSGAELSPRFPNFSVEPLYQLEPSRAVLFTTFKLSLHGLVEFSVDILDLIKDSGGQSESGP